MEFDEKIHTHLMSVWRESKSFFGVGGKEGMLLLTDNHFIFLKRTERMKNGGVQQLRDKLLHYYKIKIQ